MGSAKPSDLVLMTDWDLHKRAELAFKIMEDMQMRGEWPGKYQQEVSTIINTVTDGAVKVCAASLTTGGCAHFALRAAMPRWWKTRAAVVALGVVSCATVGSAHHVMKGCKTILSLPHSMFAEIICPETIQRCSQVPSDQEEFDADTPFRILGLSMYEAAKICKQREEYKAQAASSNKRSWLYRILGISK